MPLVSVIVPCYNVERFLARCMDSLLSQTLQDIEILLVDDGSPDKVPQMCDDYANRYSNVKVVHKQNAGLGFARNSGLEVATGEYVAFVDSDDYVENGMYQSLYNEAIASDADVVFCNFYTEKENGSWQESNEVVEKKNWNGNQVKEFMFDMIACAPKVKQERKYQMSVWHSLYRRNIIEKNNIRFHSEREILSEDLPFQIDFLKSSDKVVFLPQSFYRYCNNLSSLTSINRTFKHDLYERICRLHDLMCSQLGEVEGARTRIDRFYIGYLRSMVCWLLESTEINKKQILHTYSSDKRFVSIYDRYKISHLPIYQGLVAYLLYHQQFTLLNYIIKLVSYLKKRK